MTYPRAIKTREDLIVIYNKTSPYRSGRRGYFGGVGFVPLFLLSAVVVIVLSLFHPVFAQIPFPPKKTIALLSDGRSDPQNNLTIRFQKALEILAEGEITPVFKKSAGADWQREKAAIALKKPSMIRQWTSYLSMAHYPDAEPLVAPFNESGGPDYQMAARFSGDDPAILRALSEKARGIMADHPKAMNIRDNWRNRIPVWTPGFSQIDAQLHGRHHHGRASLCHRPDAGVYSHPLVIFFRIPASGFLLRKRILTSDQTEV